jgi:hypothetical protein
MKNTGQSLLEQKIAALGGKGAVAELFNIKVPSVHGWLYTGNVPPQRLSIFTVLFPSIFTPSNALVGAGRHALDVMGVRVEDVTKWAVRRHKQKPACSHLARVLEFYPEVAAAVDTSQPHCDTVA